MQLTRKGIQIANNILSIANVCIGIYLVVMPLLPNASLIAAQVLDTSRGYHYKSQLATSLGTIADSSLGPQPTVPTLVIPQIGVDGEILIGNNPNLINQGIWHRPLSSTPPRGGNTVIVAHRFQYTTGPNTFYHLDKVDIGDRFFIFWNGIEYDYEVFNIQVVPPTAAWVEEDTVDDIVTLYTCTPLWTAQNRLVVQARQITIDE